MAASVRIVQKNTAGATLTDASAGVRFKMTDDANVDLNNPIVKPNSGSVLSCTKYLRMEVTGGTYSQITGVKAYSDGTNSLGTGINIWAKADPTYSTPSVPANTSGYTDFFSFTSGSALSLGAGPFTSTGEKGSHLVLLCEVLSTATGGLKSGDSAFVGWDEI